MSTEPPKVSRPVPLPPTSPRSPSNWQASVDLSLTTRRRLVRKPLPQVPAAADTSSQQSDEDMKDYIDPISLDATSRQAEAWWPASLPEKRSQSDSAASHGQGLDDQCLQHLLVILHYAALRPTSLSGSTTVTATGTYKAASSSKKASSLYTLDPVILDSLFVALQQAFRHLSQKQLLGSLQRTASIRWRAEAQLRSASAAHAAELSQGESSSRWTRFAWPAAALGKAYRDAQRNVVTPSSAEWNAGGTVSSSYFQANQDLLASYAGYENRIRKRDVAVQILSNAVWFVRNYGPLAGVEDVHDPSDEELGAAAAGPSSSFSIVPSRQTDTIGRSSDNLLRKNAGLPGFMSKATPTTALSATATAKTTESDVSKPQTSRTSSFASTTSSTALDTASPSREHSRSPRPAEAGKTQSAAGEKSKAMEHLASLSAAAGAVLQKKALEAGSDNAAALDTTKRLQPKSSRQSLRSIVSQSEGEEAETNALLIAAPSRGCDEWAKMVLCRICTDVTTDSDKGRKRRSGTITAKDIDSKNPASRQVDVVGSSFSSRSDMTAKAVRLDGEAPSDNEGTDEGNAVVWKPDYFAEDELFVHGTAASQQRRPGFSTEAEDERVKIVGGTFVCRVRDEEQREALDQLLELAMYVGSSMLLETSFLRDSNAGRPKVLKVPTRSTSTVDTPQRGTSLFRRPSMSSSVSSRSLTDDDTESTLATSSQDHLQTQAETSPKGAARRWKKGLWGMLGQQEAEAPVDRSKPVNLSAPAHPSRINSSDDRVVRKPPVPPPRSRHSILPPKDESNQLTSSRRSSIAPSDETSPSKASSSHTREKSETNARAPRFGRLFNAFSKPSNEAVGSSGAQDSKAAVASKSSFGAGSDYAPMPNLKPIGLTPSSSVRRRHAKKAPPSVFPLHSLAAKPFSTSPELSMLQCYQQGSSLDDHTQAYLVAFSRLQSIRLLANQKSDLVTFATASYGIAAPALDSASRASSAFSDGTTRSRYASVRLAQPLAQPIKCELRSSIGYGLRREEIVYYQRLSKSHDVPLGQFIEELSVRISGLQADAENTSGQTESKLISASDADKLARNTTYGTAEQRLDYLHGSHRVKIIATMLPSNLYDSAKETESADATETLSKGLAPSPLLPSVQTSDAGQVESSSGIWMWNASSQSGWQARAAPMSEPTYLMSFARFLEAVTYHPALRRAGDLEPSSKSNYGGLSNLQQQLREGRTEDTRSIAEGANLLRMFRLGRTLVKVQVQPVVTYDLCIEGPCLYGSSAHDQTSTQRRKARKEQWIKSEELRLQQLLDDSRLEIQSFFASVKRETTRLESVFVSRELDEAGKTIRKRPSFFGSRFEEKSSSQSPAETISQLGSPAVGSQLISEPLNLLSGLKASFRTDEFELYDALHHVQLIEDVNDMRKAFVDRAKSAKNRLDAWIKKHLTKKEQQSLGNRTYDEPEYLQNGRHAFPGSSYVIREDEPLSIVAFSLSSRDFQSEISGTGGQQGYFESSKSVIQWRDGLSERNDVAAGTVKAPFTGSMFSSNTLRERTMRKVPIAQLNPDVDEVFYDAEPVQATLKRKKRAQESSILSLTLRRVGSTISDSKSNAATPLTESPPKGAAGGDTYKANRAPGTEGARNYRDTVGSRRPSDLRSQSSFSSIPDRKSSIQQPAAGTLSSAANNTFQMQVAPASGRSESLASLFSTEKPAASAPNTNVRSVPQIPAGVRRSREGSHKADPDQSASQSTSLSETQSLMTPGVLPEMMPVESPHVKHNLVHGTTKISCVSWFAEDFAALRGRWGVEHDFAQSLSRCQPWNTTGGKSKSAFFKTQDERFIAKQLLTVWSVDEKEAFLEFAPAYIRYMMNAVVNECPTLLVKIAGVYSIKIKDTKTGEVKLRMNLMVLENLWAQDGGHSVRFDLKGIRDRKVKLTPQQQQELQANEASVAGAQTMTSVLGGPATGATTQSTGQPEPSTRPTDAHEQQGSRINASAFGEGSKKEERSSAVWWDSEWIERYRNRAFVPETQKELFFRAVQNDTQFLTASNVMDYSLLLGVIDKPLRAQDLYPTAAGTDTEPADGDGEGGKSIFRCRIVDFLGAFTLAKQLESSSKKALKAGLEAKGNVTILPPSEYATRFQTAMDSYFIGTPCQPRLDAGYKFDQECYEAATGALQDDRLRLPAVL